MHIAFGKIASAGVERKAAGRRNKVFEGEKVIGRFRLEKAMLGQRHRDTAGEVLVALDHSDIGGTKAGHAIEVWRDRIEARAAVEWRIVRYGSRAISGSEGRAEHVNRLLTEFPCALLGHQHESCGTVV